jgi:hypothetical protein
MASLPLSPPPQKIACNEPENDNPSSLPPSPKRSFALTDEADHTPSSLGYSKRRHVHNDGEATTRAPLGKFSASYIPDTFALVHTVNADPLSSSEIDNRSHQDPRWSESLFTPLPLRLNCDRMMQTIALQITELRIKLYVCGCLLFRVAMLVVQLEVVAENARHSPVAQSIAPMYRNQFVPHRPDPHQGCYHRQRAGLPPPHQNVGRRLASGMWTR